MKEDTSSTQATDRGNVGLAENLAFSISRHCPICGDLLCEHGRCAMELEVCEACAPSILMDAMKHVSVVSGPAMGASEYRGFMNAMRIFSLAMKEILEGRQ